MTTSHPPTTITKSANQQLWSTNILPSTLQSQGLHCHDQTPKSAQHLLSRGQLNAMDFIETSPDIERTLMEAFLEDDYDGRLHLTTLSIMRKSKTSNNSTSQDGEEEEIVGMSFWREVPSDEMNEWMDMQRISKAIADRKLTTSHEQHEEDDHEDDLPHDAKKAMELIKSHSIGWIQNALQPCTSPMNHTSTDRLQPTKAIIQKLTHALIKIELIAIKRIHRAHHLGNILLGCTLARAHAFHHNEHAILHVAGGGASKNVPAAMLYKRYGFVSVPKHDEGGPFVKPDRDLYVLGNIGLVLNSLPWEDTMQIRSSDGDDYSNGGK